MGCIFYLMGKSSTGKDTIFKELRKACPQLKTIVLYTTRPRREGEIDGQEYYFVDESRLSSLIKADQIIELREYHTIEGIWKYFTVADGQIDLEGNSYMVIGTLESYQRMIQYFDDGKVIPIYVEVEDGERLARALAREKRQARPGYAEMCRRFLADEEDFSEENLRMIGINKRFYNHNLKHVINEIRLYVQGNL